jgi:hypothetical protein
MPELLRVIPVGRTVPEHAGGVIVVASVELWSDAVVLRTAEVTPPPNPVLTRSDRCLSGATTPPLKRGRRQTTSSRRGGQCYFPHATSRM